MEDEDNYPVESPVYRDKDDRIEHLEAELLIRCRCCSLRAERLPPWSRRSCSRCQRSIMAQRVLNGHNPLTGKKKEPTESNFRIHFAWASITVMVYVVISSL